MDPLSASLDQFCFGPKYKRAQRSKYKVELKWNEIQAPHKFQKKIEKEQKCSFLEAFKNEWVTVLISEAKSIDTQAQPTPKSTFTFFFFLPSSSSKWLQSTSSTS